MPKSASKFSKDFRQNFAEFFSIFKKIFLGVAGCADRKGSSSGIEKHGLFCFIIIFWRVSGGSERRGGMGRATHPGFGSDGE